MTDLVSIDVDGAAAARSALESCALGGGVAVFPADTLYGLGCDPQNEAAVERVHALKGRQQARPSAVMFLSPLAMRELVSTLGPRTRDALAALLPGAVTLVVANPEHRFPLACREDPARLGVRLIEGPLAGVSCALFQTSANPSGEPAPATLDAVDQAIVDGADLAIDGGAVGGAPSTVIDLTGIEVGEPWRILREGAVPAAEVQRRLTGAERGD